MEKLNNIKENDIKGITSVSVEGYKSIANNTEIEIRPLTILAGANSSGKSSILQPLLMMKQTLEETYDPGSLLIDGPNVEYTLASQFLTKIGNVQRDNFKIKIEVNKKLSITQTFTKIKEDKPIELSESVYQDEKGSISLRKNIKSDELINYYPEFNDLIDMYSKRYPITRLRSGSTTFIKKGNIEEENGVYEAFVYRNRCLFEVGLREKIKGKERVRERIIYKTSLSDRHFHEQHILEIIHVPALRGNPRRSYKRTATGPRFQGTLDNYVASIIYNWYENSNINNIRLINTLGDNLKKLELTCQVDAKKIDETRVELRVHRLNTPINDDIDTVNITDVGFGVSQVLPVIVALLVAKKGQFVYIEQPEIHLHPRAQYKLAELLVQAANNGARIVIETHSDYLLRGIQTQVAEQEISPEKLKLHWFRRTPEGITEVISRDVDETGAFGDWPVDFAEISMDADNRYLDAVESHILGD